MGGAAGPPDSLGQHDRARAGVADHRERHDLLPSELLEREPQALARRLRRPAVAPRAASQPPADLGFALQALWWDAKGDWDKAHECAQVRDDDAGMSVHAYLHRKEGDLSNAGYWYRRCGRPPATVTLEQEWQALAVELLGAA